MQARRPHLGLFWLLSWEGRIGRAEYLLRLLIAWFVFVSLLFPLSLLGYEASLIISGVLSTWIYLGAQKRRLNDFGASGYWMLLMLVPIVNIGFVLALMFRGGDPQPNSWGGTCDLPVWRESKTIRSWEKTTLLTAFTGSLVAFLGAVFFGDLKSESDYVASLFLSFYFVGIPVSLVALVPMSWRWFLRRVAEFSSAVRSK